jgi:hypothetical protein
LTSDGQISRSDSVLPPRALSKAQAAAYLGLTPGGFVSWIRAGRIPRALPGTHRWDRVALDRALDKMSGILVEVGGPELSPLQKWLEQKNGERKAELQTNQQKALRRQR